MTISKERFEHLVTTCWYADDDLSNGDLDALLNFAHALLKAVEAESSAVGYGVFDSEGRCYAVRSRGSSLELGGESAITKLLIALPLVSSEKE